MTDGWWRGTTRDSRDAFAGPNCTDDGLLLADAGGFPDAADSLVGLHTDEEVDPGSAGAADVGGEDCRGQ